VGPVALVVLASCAAPTPPAVVVSAEPRVSRASLPPLRSTMERHFVDAVSLEIAVAGGDLDAVRLAAGRLRDGAFAMPAPEGVGVLVDELRLASDRAAAAGTLAEAARATGEVLYACSRCHVATTGGPKDPVQAPPAEPPSAAHVYGAYWLGHGVLAPDDAAWLAGAEALARAPLAERPEVEARVRALAATARTTADGAARAALWSDLLLTCAACHAEPTP
jgi:hypothetical protein